MSSNLVKGLTCYAQIEEPYLTDKIQFKCKALGSMFNDIFTIPSLYTKGYRVVSHQITPNYIIDKSTKTFYPNGYYVSLVIEEQK